MKVGWNQVSMRNKITMYNGIQQTFFQFRVICLHNPKIVLRLLDTFINFACQLLVAIGDGGNWAVVLTGQVTVASIHWSVMRLPAKLN